MNQTTTNKGLTIGAIERDVGIRSATLRIWERRYGFPSPVRDEGGDRVYPEDQLERLRLVRRLMNHGHRPGKIVPLSSTELRQLLDEIEEQSVAPREIDVLLEAAYRQDGVLLARELDRLLLLQGLGDFVLDTIAPFLRAVGEGWSYGKLQIYQEHFITRQLTRFLDTALSQLGRSTAEPEVLLATLPGEQHSLGNLMLEVLLAHKGTRVHNLGTEVPIDQLVDAAVDLKIPVLALSFSGSYPYRTMRSSLKELLEQLPPEVTIWIGGGGTEQMQRMPGKRIKRKQLEEFSGK